MSGHNLNFSKVNATVYIRLCNQTQTHQIQMSQVVSTKFYRLFLNEMIRPPESCPPSPVLPPRARHSRPTSEAAPSGTAEKVDDCSCDSYPAIATLISSVYIYIYI